MPVTAYAQVAEATVSLAETRSSKALRPSLWNILQTAKIVMYDRVQRKSVGRDRPRDLALPTERPGLREGMGCRATSFDFSGPHVACVCLPSARTSPQWCRIGPLASRSPPGRFPPHPSSAIFFPVAGKDFPLCSLPV